MPDDERAIRELVQTWLAASQKGDLQTVLGLMAVAASFKGLKGVRLEMSSDIKEIKVLADWAYLRNYLEVTMTPRDGGASVRRSGYTLTILRKESDGRRLLARDANLLAPQT